MSKIRGAIDQQAHMAWFAKAVQDHDRIILIALEADEKLGVVRFDRRGDLWLVSVSIAPEQRGGVTERVSWVTL
jgi:hypothetical protein